MTRAILLPIVLLVLGASLFGMYQYFTLRKKEREWQEKEKDFEDLIVFQNQQINALQNGSRTQDWY